MKILSMIAAAVVLAACSSTPETPQQAQQSNPCLHVDAPTGSRILRKIDCDRSQVVVGNQEEVRGLQDLQRQTTNPLGRPGS